MPLYNVTTPDGRSIELEGASAPSEQELEGVFSSLPAVPSGNTQAKLGNDFTPEELDQVYQALSTVDTEPIAKNIRAGTARPSFKSPSLSTALGKVKKLGTKKNINRVITVGQIASGLAGSTPQGKVGARVLRTVGPVAAQFAGEFVKALNNGHDIDTAIDAGTKGSAIDVGARVVIGGLFGPGTVKVLQKTVDVLPIPTLRKFSKGLLKRVMKGGLISTEASDHILEEAPQYLRPALNSTIDKKAKIAGDIVVAKRAALGKLVGETEEKAATTLLNNVGGTFISDVRELVTTSLKELPTEDSSVRSITGVLNRLVPQLGVKELAKKASIKEALIWSQKAKPLTHGEYTKFLKNLDAHSTMKKVLKEQTDKGFGSLSVGEKGLINMRRELKSLGDRAIADEPIRNSMVEARRTFHKYASRLEELDIDAKKGITKKMADAADKAILRKHVEEFNSFQELAIESGAGPEAFDSLLGRAALDKLPIVGADRAIGRLLTSAVDGLAVTNIVPQKTAKLVGALTRQGLIGVQNPEEKRERPSIRRPRRDKVR